eukprot:5057957-Prymnesium_polylepis.1
MPASREAPVNVVPSLCRCRRSCPRSRCPCPCLLPCLVVWRRPRLPSVRACPPVALRLGRDLVAPPSNGASSFISANSEIPTEQIS